MSSAMLPALMAFAPFFAILLFCAMRRQKPCPDCGEPLPETQSPFRRTRRQWLEGGYLCRKCGCEVDIAGRKVLAGTPLRVRSFVAGIVLLTLVAVPAVILTAFLLQR